VLPILERCCRAAALGQYGLLARRRFLLGGSRNREVALARGGHKCELDLRVEPMARNPRRPRPDRRERLEGAGELGGRVARRKGYVKLAPRRGRRVNPWQCPRVRVLSAEACCTLYFYFGGKNLESCLPCSRVSPKLYLVLCGPSPSFWIL